MKTFEEELRDLLGKYIEKVASPQVLNHAWRYLRNDRSPWQCGLSVAEMQKNLIQHIGELTQ